MVAFFKGFPGILRKRKNIMKIKVRPDKRTLQGKNIDMLGEAGGQIVVRVAVKFLNIILKMYWWAARWFIK
jgi:hypothetical protein